MKPIRPHHLPLASGATKRISLPLCVCVCVGLRSTSLLPPSPPSGSFIFVCWRTRCCERHPLFFRTSLQHHSGTGLRGVSVLSVSARLTGSSVGLVACLFWCCYCIGRAPPLLPASPPPPRQPRHARQPPGGPHRSPLRSFLEDRSRTRNAAGGARTAHLRHAEPQERSLRSGLCASAEFKSSA